MAAGRTILDWAQSAMQPDPHGEPALGGAYEISTLYLDTPRFDVYHRARELKGTKLRLRRYGTGALAYLERKQRRGDRVRKRRSSVPEPETARLGAAPAGEWAGAWFHEEIAARGFRPVCALTYLRTAFFGSADHGTFRLTLDRDIRAARAYGWGIPRSAGGILIAEDVVVCELKFRSAMPQPLKQLVARAGLSPSALSKYRRACLAIGLIEAGKDTHA